MKEAILGILLAIVISIGTASSVFAVTPNHVLGRILIDVDRQGQAYYISPVTGYSYYLGRPEDAYEIMKNLGLGISNQDLERLYTDRPMQQRLAGQIVLAVHTHGEAYYIDPVDYSIHYLKDGEAALALMRSKGLGARTAVIDSIVQIETVQEVGDTTATDDSIIHSVPFVAQAPFGDWSDERQAQACEEASVLMALAWAKGEPLTQQSALDSILAMSDWEQETYGYFQDTSVQDTADRLMKEYSNYHSVEVATISSASRILDELHKGNLVLTATNGQLQNHSLFTEPGPLRHMIVIYGYDAKTSEFLYHEPGSQYGAGIRATATELMSFIRDYDSGRYVPITTTAQKILIVRKQ